MSGVLILRKVMLSVSGITDLVPATRLVAGDLPINVVFPAISLTDISSSGDSRVSGSTMDVIETERVQVYLFAKTFAELKGLTKVVRRSVPLSKGVAYDGCVCQSVSYGGTGPYMRDLAYDLHMQSIDYMVTYKE